MITIFLRAIFLYLILIVALRLMGKRQIAQLQPYELVFAIVIADLASSPMAEEGVPLVRGVLPILALVVVNTVITILCMKSERVRLWICGKPSVVIRKGKVDAGEMHKIAYSLTDLSEQIRASGTGSIADVDTAVLETGGTLSVFPVADKRPVTPRDLDLAAKRDSVPITLVLDGRVQEKNLRLISRDKLWLEKLLRRANVKDGARSLVYALIEIDGTFIAQGSDAQDTMYRLAQAYEEEASW